MNVMDIMNTLRTASNPIAILESMAQNNPNMQSVVDYLKANGNDPKSAFYAMAKEKGVDPNMIFNLMKGF